MDNFRSLSVKDGERSFDRYSGGNQVPISMKDLRSYSTSYATTSAHAATNDFNYGVDAKEVKIKKSKSKGASLTSKTWSFTDPELKRKKRVARYKVYDVEGKMKSSLRKSFRWIKDTCNHAIYGWR